MRLWRQEEAEITRHLKVFCKRFHFYFLHLDQLSVEAWTCQFISNPPLNPTPEFRTIDTLPRLSYNQKNSHVFTTVTRSDMKKKPQKNNLLMASTHCHVHGEDELMSCPLCKPFLHWRKLKCLKILFWNHLWCPDSQRQKRLKKTTTKKQRIRIKKAW